MNFCIGDRITDKRRLIVALGIVLAIGFIATTLVNYTVSKASIRGTLIASELPLTSDNVYSEIQRDLVRPVVISSMMASDTFLRDWMLAGERDTATITKYLREVKQRYGAFTSFLVSERTRTYYQTEGVLKKVSENEPRDAWYFRVRKMEAPYEINVDPDQANKDALTIFINYRVQDYDGRYLGTAGVGLTVDAVRARINDYQKRYQRTIYFVDKQGQLALYGDHAHFTRKSLYEIDGLRDIADEVLRAGEGTFQYRSRGYSHLLNVRYIPELNWYLFVEGSEDEALAGIRRTLYVNLAIGLLIMAIVLAATSFTINRYQGRLEAMATSDHLTGLANRQAFDLLMPQAMRQARRNKAPLQALLIDIDHFKDVNDRLGHPAGDSVIQQVAATIRGAVRESDIVCRWGGEEFLVVAAGVSDTDGPPLAEKIRLAVESRTFHHEETPVSVTVSVGIAPYKTGDTVERLIARADRALYEAKERGRNVVRVADPVSRPPV